MIAQLVTSFIASAGFGVIFNVPKNALFQCGIAGMVGWIIYVYLEQYLLVDTVLATVVAAFFIAVVSQFFAKLKKAPIIIFNVSGIIPLVPGGLAYNAMRHFVENDYNTALQFAAKAFVISGAIAIGLVFSEVINQMIRRSRL